MGVIETEHGEPSAELVLMLAERFGTGGLTRETFDQWATEVQLPARSYAPVLTAAMNSNIVVDLVTGDESASAHAESRGDETEGPGWNVDGLSHFVQRSHHRVLDAEEEQALGRLISKGRLAQQMLDERPDIDVATRTDLRRMVTAGERAGNELALHNIRLVISIAGRLSRGCTPALALDDLVQEGYEGLAHAISKWDYTRGLKFSTYATWWIHQRVDRAIKNQAAAIRLPVHVVEDLRRLRRAEASLRSEGVPTTAANAAARLGCSIRKVERLRVLPMASVSLDRPSPGRSTALSDDLPSPYVDAVEDAASHAWLVAALDDALAGLSAREQEVIRLRFGLLDGKPRTLEEVGQEFGVTRERIRQIEHKALKKLRHPQHASRLLEYYGATPTHKDHDDARDRSA